MKKNLLIIISIMSLLVLSACNASELEEKEKQIGEQEEKNESLESEITSFNDQIEEQEEAKKEGETNNQDDKEIEEELEEVDTTENESDEFEENINSIDTHLNKIVSTDLDNVSVTDLRINNDASVDEERYIVLVDVEWDMKNRPKTTKEMLDMYSDHLAAKLSDEELIYELVLFWTVPYHKENDSILKRTYENKEGNMYLEDEMKDFSVFD